VSKESRKLRPVSTLTHESLVCERLRLALAQHRRLLASVRGHLPAALASACGYAQVRDRQLLVYVDSAAYASRLRFLAPTLLAALRREFPGLKTIQFRVRPSSSEPPAQRRAVLSGTARTALRNAATHIDDRELQAALARLSRAGRSDD
jgi:hypothetical protein